MTRTYRISRPDQIAALASPARVEIVDMLMSLGKSSVTAIAAALGRPADALYYHLRHLVRVGLVQPAGEGRGKRREEALYRAVARRYEVVYDPEDPANVAAMNRTAASMLRLGARDFRLAFAPGAAASGPRRELWVGRLTGRLSSEEIARVNRLVKALLALFDGSRARSNGRMMGMTFLLVPLERSARRKASGRERRRR